MFTMEQRQAGDQVPIARAGPAAILSLIKINSDFCGSEIAKTSTDGDSFKLILLGTFGAYVVIAGGLEPPTYCLEGSCSIQLSYATL